MNDLFVDYVWIDFPKRTVSVQDSDGNLDKIKFKWDEEGAEGFAEFVNKLQSMTTPDIRHYQL
jgi:hypothetical protein